MSAIIASDPNRQHYSPISPGDFPAIVPRAFIPNSLPFQTALRQSQLPESLLDKEEGEKRMQDLLDTLNPYVYSFIKSYLGASGTNTVAIDNKIEQAMDLVKSHLMFAVREEVEVLKEKIAELMERIGHLEYENTVLRTNATQETLAQLQQTQSTQQQSLTTLNTNGATTGSSSVSVNINSAAVTPNSNSSPAGPPVVNNSVNSTTNG